MRYIGLRRGLKGYTIFSLGDIKKIDPKFHRRRLNEWQAKKYIMKVVRGYYIFSDMELNEKVLFEIANRIYDPSYISFEKALSYYGLIPESVYAITSASARRTYSFKTKVGEFIYRTIKRPLFFGYDLIEYGDRRIKIACPEKAILDYFYMNPSIAKRDDFASIRINKELFMKLIDMKKLKACLKRFTQRRLRKRIKSFLEFMENA